MRNRSGMTSSQKTNYIADGVLFCMACSAIIGGALTHILSWPVGLIVGLIVFVYILTIYFGSPP